MYELKYTINETTNTYSSFACTCDQSNEVDYASELVRIINEECSLTLNGIDDLYGKFGFTLYDQLTYLLDEQGYGIISIVTDMWSGMQLSHVYQPKNFPKLYVQYDQFVYGFVDAYHLAKLAVLQNTVGEKNETT